MFCSRARANTRSGRSCQVDLVRAGEDLDQGPARHAPVGVREPDAVLADRAQDRPGGIPAEVWGPVRDGIDRDRGDTLGREGEPLAEAPAGPHGVEAAVHRFFVPYMNSRLSMCASIGSPRW